MAKLPRARFIPLVYHFFVANIALFWLFLTLGIAPVIVARVFFVWVSVFSLFAVAVFWSFMADLFTAEQGKRLFVSAPAGLPADFWARSLRWGCRCRLARSTF